MIIVKEISASSFTELNKKLAEKGLDATAVISVKRLELGSLVAYYRKDEPLICPKCCSPLKEDESVEFSCYKCTSNDCNYYTFDIIDD